MSIFRGTGRLASLAVTCVLAAIPATAKDFTFSEKVNGTYAQKLGIPIYFSVPSSARAPLKGPFNTSDVLLDWKHPDAIKTGSDAGLRLIVTSRSGMSSRLGKSGIIETGDLLLTFRPEWGGAGAYPNVQMGISHAAVAYIKDGKLHHIENPMNEEYLGSGLRADLTSENYRSVKFLHVVRPRNLTDADRAHILAWATLFNKNAGSVYPSQIKFNDDYNAPKYKSGRSLGFVSQMAQAGLKQTPGGGQPLDLYCSEFAWSLLALRGCDPQKDADDFKSSRVPSCVKSPMHPLDATGNNLTSRSRSADIGLVDGPLTIIDQLKMTQEARTELLQSVFKENPEGLKKMSVGHRKVAETLQPQFQKLRDYYLGVSGGNIVQRTRAKVISATFNYKIPDNYSPTSFLLNTLLPPENSNRTMDYVATIVIQ